MKKFYLICLLVLIFPVILSGCQTQSSGASWAWYAWTAMATVFLGAVAIVAIFYETIRRFRNRPRLAIEFESERPDYIKIPVGEVANPHDKRPREFIQSYFVRFRVVNHGRKTAAEDIEAFLSDIWCRHEGPGEGEYFFRPYERHIPGHLRWSMKQWNEVEKEQDVSFYPRINKEMARIWNLCYIVDPAYAYKYPIEDPVPVLKELYPELSVMQIPIDGPLLETPVLILDTVVKSSSRSYILPSGYYMLEVVVAASNAEKVVQYFDVDFQGKWNDKEHEMRKFDLVVRPISVVEAKARKDQHERSQEPRLATR